MNGDRRLSQWLSQWLVPATPAPYLSPQNPKISRSIYIRSASAIPCFTRYNPSCHRYNPVERPLSARCIGGVPQAARALLVLRRSERWVIGSDNGRYRGYSVGDNVSEYGRCIVHDSVGYFPTWTPREAFEKLSPRCPLRCPSPMAYDRTSV